MKKFNLINEYAGMKMQIKVGLVQMNSSSHFEENMKHAETMLAAAANSGLDLITFPETFLYIGKDHAEKQRVAASLDQEILPFFCESATKHDYSILLGSVYEPVLDDSERLFNTSILIDKKGQVSARYRKIHMCDAPQLGYLESAGIKPGNETVVVDHELGKLGLTICYDVRFPELYQSLSAQGAEVVFVPSAFFLHTGKHHWLPLLIARAIENQVYIVAPNQWGHHYDERISYGSSVIIDPWGSVICCAPEREGISVGTIDLDYLRQVRTNMPVHSHRRPEFYA